MEWKNVGMGAAMAAAAVAISTHAHAGSVLVPASEYGLYSNNSTYNNDRGSLYNVGKNKNLVEYRNYFTFLIPDLGGDITGASLVLTAGKVLGGPISYTLFDATGISGLATDHVDGGGKANFDAMIAGASFGTFELQSPDPAATYTLDLAAAVSAIDGLQSSVFALSGAVLDLNNDRQHELAFINPEDPQIALLLQYRDPGNGDGVPQSVPTPAAATAGLALLSLLGLRRRRR